MIVILGWGVMFSEVLAPGHEMEYADMKIDKCNSYNIDIMTTNVNSDMTETIEAEKVH